MPLFHAIAAMSENRVIGHQGKIPWHLPEDFRWFKHKTMGGTLVMGRKTFESIGRPLPGRKTVVVSKWAQIDGVEMCRDVLELISRQSEELHWICGGGQIYAQTLDHCRYLYLTRVAKTVSGDAFMPDFEDQFEREQIIHQAPCFQVERWIHRGDPRPAAESWPFPG